MIHSCLNRLQLTNNLQMVNLADPIGSFQMAPIYPTYRLLPSVVAG